jgi:hypothetical protein
MKKQDEKQDDSDRYRRAIFGNPLDIRARAPGAVYSKELLKHVCDVLWENHKAKRKCEK